MEPQFNEAKISVIIISVALPRPYGCLSVLKGWSSHFLMLEDTLSGFVTTTTSISSSSGQGLSGYKTILRLPR